MKNHVEASKKLPVTSSNSPRTIQRHQKTHLELSEKTTRSQLKTPEETCRNLLPGQAGCHVTGGAASHGAAEA